MRRALRCAAVALLAVGVAAACADRDGGITGAGSAAGGGRPRLTLLLTDAPGDVREAVVTISEVYLQGGSGGRVWLRRDPVTVDLLELAGRALTIVDSVEVPADRYAQLRLVVTGAYLAVEAEGGGLRYFASSPDYEPLPDTVQVAGTLQLPSLGASGLKVRLPGDSLALAADETLVLDFDVAQSFGRERGRSGRWVMHPVVTATALRVTGSVTVTARLGEGVTLPTGTTLASFSARLVDAADQVAGQAALADPDGDGTFSATFRFVDPGRGPFRASLVGPAGLTFATSPAMPQTVTLASGQSVTVAFTITSVTVGS